MKLSIITVVYNSIGTIKGTIESVLNQGIADLEYIIVDGNSNDGTKEIIKSYGKRISKVISEPDKGMYDAINKGIKAASGDIIGILNADDFYNDEFVLQKVIRAFEKNNVDAIFGNIRFVSNSNLSKTVRYISGKAFRPGHVRFGFMPPHPTIFIKKNIFEQYGLYKVDYKIAADFELVVRFFLIHKIRYLYEDLDMIKMRLGGKSTKSLISNYILNRETVRACRENRVYTNLFMILFKYPFKIFEFINRSNSVCIILF